jgi:hypothetical protein
MVAADNLINAKPNPGTGQVLSKHLRPRDARRDTARLHDASLNRGAFCFRGSRDGEQKNRAAERAAFALVTLPLFMICHQAPCDTPTRPRQQSNRESPVPSRCRASASHSIFQVPTPRPRLPRRAFCPPLAISAYTVCHDVEPFHGVRTTPTAALHVAELSRPRIAGCRSSRPGSMRCYTRRSSARHVYAFSREMPA